METPVMACLECGGELAICRTWRSVYLRCGSCGVQWRLEDYLELMSDDFEEEMANVRSDRFWTMKKYQQITKARTLLELSERATMEQIKANYRRLMRQWHPDRSSGTEKKHAEMAAKLAEAYKLITEYCNQYKFSFSEEDVRHHLSDEELLSERFSKDPVWGGR